VEPVFLGKTVFGAEKDEYFSSRKNVTSVLAKKQGVWNNKVSLIIFERITCVF